MLKIYTSENPGMCVFTFPWSKEAVESYKKYPGCRYAGDEYGKRFWLSPNEAFDFLKKESAKLGYGVQDNRNKEDDQFSGPLPFLRSLHKSIHPYQREALDRISREKSLLVNFDLGLGKCLVAINTFRCFVESGNCLVVTEGSARGTWEDEIPKWDDRDCVVHIIRRGSDALKLVGEMKADVCPKKPTYVVTSYELMKYFSNSEGDNWDVLVADECHLLANPNSERSIVWLGIRNKNEGAITLGLTGTPVPDRVPQLAPQVNAIWPGRFGGKWKFTQRYHHCVKGEYGGLSVGDLREDTLEELKHRISSVSIRVTKKEVEHLLPPLTTTRVEVPFKKEDRLESLDLAKVSYGEYLSRYTDRRVKEAAEWIKNTGQSHVCALTYHIATAKKLQKLLQKMGLETSCITGQIPEKRRHEIIKNSLKQDSHLLTCSMKSIGVGVDALAGYGTAIFVELSYRPVDVTQAMGRFYRLSSLKPVTIAFLLLVGTLDDLLMDNLQPKIEQFSQIMKEGTSEDTLREILTGPKETEEDFFSRMRALV
jgi:SNF2 family DNA or RNA helicase